jgi:hypothetical protein
MEKPTRTLAIRLLMAKLQAKKFFGPSFVAFNHPKGVDSHWKTQGDSDSLRLEV